MKTIKISGQRMRQVQGDAAGYRRRFGGQRPPGKCRKGTGHARNRTVWGDVHTSRSDR